MRLLAFAGAFIGLLGLQLWWQPGREGGLARCRGCAAERQAPVSRPKVAHGRVRGGEAKVCWLPAAQEARR
ncbi:MAG: hypothetical protein QM723_29820 [Myxococcaceae bacterium]